MGFMADRPRVPLKNPYFVSLSRQKRLCPLCGRPTRLNGMPLSPDGAYEVCDGDGCGYFQTLIAPDRAKGKRVDGYPSLSVIDGGLG